MKYLVAVTIIIAICETGTLAADWPQWQGPDRNAISQETGLLQQWPEDGPPLAWRIDGLGGGYSAPSIAAGRLYGMSNRGEDEVVWCLSEADGKELWVTRLGPTCQEGGPQGSEGPGCTPTVDGNRLYVAGAGGTVACLRVDDGKILWTRSFTDDFGGRVPRWRFNESPLIDDNKVICTPGGEDAMMVALDRSTGETIWKSKVPDSTDGGAQANANAGQGRGGVGGRPSGPPTGSSQRRGTPGSQRSEDPGGRDAGSTAVTGTKDPGLFVGEHWGMSAFSCKVPNGKYLAKLYFAETFVGITGPGQRVFSFTVQGREFKDFDIWAKAGGPRRAYIEAVPVEVTDGEVRIVFTRQVENPAINAIEIVPQTEDAESAETTIRIKAGRSTPFTDSSGRVWQPDQGFEGGSFGGTFQMPRGFGAGRGGFGRGRGNFGGGRGGFGGGRGGASYASAIAIEVDGQRQYVQLVSNTLIGVAASDGKFLWRYDRPANPMGINCSTPIYQDGLVFAASAYGRGGGAAKLVKDDSGAVKVEEVYSTTRMQNHHGGMIVVDGCLYGANGGNGGGFLSCLDFQTGEVLWRDRAAPKGSLALADGRLYYRTEEGPLLLVEPNRKQYIERGRFDQPDRSESPAWTHPVIANGKLYVRDQDLLFCYDIKAK